MKGQVAPKLLPWVENPGAFQATCLLHTMGSWQGIPSPWDRCAAKPFLHISSTLLCGGGCGTEPNTQAPWL